MRQTDGRTDGQTDTSQKIFNAINISKTKIDRKLKLTHLKGIIRQCSHRLTQNRENIAFSSLREKMDDMFAYTRAYISLIDTNSTPQIDVDLIGAKLS